MVRGWRSMLVGRLDEPAMAEVAHLVDDRQERTALVGQLVLDPRRVLVVAAALDDPLLLEGAQALREGPRADPGARVLELREAACALREVVHEQRRPLRADHVRARGDGAGGRLVDRVHRAGDHAHIIGRRAGGGRVAGPPPTAFDAAGRPRLRGFTRG